MKDIDYLIPYKVIVDRSYADGEVIRQSERYVTLKEAEGVYQNTTGFCMITHRRSSGSKILKYRYGSKLVNKQPAQTNKELV